MNISISQALAIEQVYVTLKDKPLPVKTAYKISKLTRAIDGELAFYREQLQSIMDKYAKKDESGQFILNEDKTSVQLIPECVDECQEAIKNLSDITLNVDLKTTFTLDELDSLDLSLQDITAFEPFIEE